WLLIPLRITAVRLTSLFIPAIGEGRVSSIRELVLLLVLLLILRILILRRFLRLLIRSDLDRQHIGGIRFFGLPFLGLGIHSDDTVLIGFGFCRLISDAKPSAAILVRLRGFDAAVAEASFL